MNFFASVSGTLNSKLFKRHQKSKFIYSTATHPTDPTTRKIQIYHSSSSKCQPRRNSIPWKLRSLGWFWTNGAPACLQKRPQILKLLDPLLSCLISPTNKFQIYSIDFARQPFNGKFMERSAVKQKCVIWAFHAAKKVKCFIDKQIDNKPPNFVPPSCSDRV